MNSMRVRGFTLIELLTVIAIISILAAMIFVGGPRVIERVKIAHWENTCNQLRTALVSYYTKSRDTYPPAYGSMKSATINPKFPADDENYYWINPYLIALDEFSDKNVYDRFSNGYDTDGDGVLSLLEFSPMGQEPRPHEYTFPKELYRGNNLQNEVAAQRNSTDPRPITYIPVWLADARRVEKFYFLVAAQPPDGLGRTDDGQFARIWQPGLTFPKDPNPLSQPQPIRVPPARLDDYVFISVGPVQNTCGILTPPASFVADLNSLGIPQDKWCYYFALRAYYLATRDLNRNGQPDFDYR